jgi:bacterioferritin (cytochrome b1)
MNEVVVESLNKSISLHLEASYHYLLASVQFGLEYPKLGETLAAYAYSEQLHLREVAERLNFFEVRPTSEHLPPASWEYLDYESFLDASLAMAERAREIEQDGIIDCRAEGDETSALLFARLLAGSEEFIRGVQATKTRIDQAGLDNVLSSFI